MTSDQKKEKILAAIKVRGWTASEIYIKEWRELVRDGLVKRDHIYSVGGNRRMVLVAA